MNKTDNYFESMLTEEERSRLPYLETIPLLLKKCSEDYGDSTAITDDRQTLNYLQLYDNIGKRIDLLESKGIPDQGHVAVICRNNVDAMCWLLAIPSSGRVVVMLSCTMTAEDIANIIPRYDIDAVVAEACFLPLTEDLPVPVIDASACGDQPSPFADVCKDTTAAIYLTGGTTGMPKGVVLSHGSLMRGAKNGTYRPGGTVFGNRTILMLPLSHIFGTVMSYLSCLYTGTEIHGCSDVKSGLMSIPVVRPTLLVLVPGIVEIILDLAGLKGAEFLGDLKVIICGGAPVPPRLIRAAGSYGIKLYPGYGMTEGANLTSANIDLDTKPHSMGKIYPGQEVKVVDGELWIRGDNVMKGYYKDPAATAEALTEDGWLKTGDLVSFDEEEFITITGRTSNLIILPNGENVSPEELEDIFDRSDLIRDCLVKEDTENSRPLLAIEILPLPQVMQGRTPEETEALIREEVKRINATLPSYKQVNKITVRQEDFKRTGALKIDRLHSQ